MKRLMTLLAVVVSFSGIALGQLPDNVERGLRPIVHVEFISELVSSEDEIAQGVFDTGSPLVYLAPETQAVLAEPVSPADATLTDRSTLSVGGFHGAALDGPEHIAGGLATHLYDSATRRPNTAPVILSDIAASIDHFSAVSGTFSLVNIGMPAVSNPRSPYVARIDPTVASTMPFGLASTPTSVDPLDILGDNRMSNVSFLVSFDPNTPNLTANHNPDFLTGVALTPEYGTGFLATTSVDINGDPDGPTTAPRPKVTLGPSNPFGIALGGPTTYFVDSGSPGTSAPGAPAATRLLGTDNLNKFTQYWDFGATPGNGGSPTMLLFGPTAAGDQELAGPGMIIGVGRSSTGLTHTGVNQLDTYGQPPLMSPDSAAAERPGVPGEASASLFRTHASHANAAYINGLDAYGLTGGDVDDIDGTSLGADAIGPAEQTTVYFSVAGNAIAFGGLGFGGGVAGQTAVGHAPGDIFESETATATPLVGGTNELRFNQDVLGLGANAGPMVSAAGRGNVDNLNALDLRTQDALGMSNVMRNLDPTITVSGDTTNPDGALPGGLGVRGDVLGATFNNYFTLDAASTATPSPASIFVNKPSGGGVGFDTYATHTAAGLLLGDDIDAFALDLVGGGPMFGLSNIADTLIDLRYAPDTSGIDGLNGLTSDMMIFSLTPGSPTLSLITDPGLGRPFSPADLFITDFDGTFALYATAESLGLAPDADIDALDTHYVIPTPTTLVLLLPGLAAAFRRPGRGAVRRQAGVMGWR